jgi:hypothetical protein
MIVEAADLQRNIRKVKRKDIVALKAVIAAHNAKRKVLSLQF